jgi:hypothetical protein
MCAAFGVTASVGLMTLLLFGSGRQGTHFALLATARVAFVLFWAAYAGGPLAILLGPGFSALKRHGRNFGLAFASALTAHIGVVAWLCWIGAAPGLRVFVFFGFALFCTYALAALSFEPLKNALGARWWLVIRALAMNDIALAFAVDFFRHPLGGSPGHMAAYVPFALLSAIGPALYVAASVRQGISMRAAAQSAIKQILRA